MRLYPFFVINRDIALNMISRLGRCEGGQKTTAIPFFLTLSTGRMVNFANRTRLLPHATSVQLAKAVFKFCTMPGTSSVMFRWDWRSGSLPDRAVSAVESDGLIWSLISFAPDIKSAMPDFATIWSRAELEASARQPGQ